VEVEARMWRSELLGEQREVALPQGRVQYFVRGDGPPLVLAHGWLANANLWRTVVDRLADRFTCIALDLPFGSHRVPMDPAADLSPEGVGDLLAAILDTLDLRDVTLAGNDSGGAYSQIATAARPDRVARLVLNSCETPYDEWPPPPFDGLPALVQDPQMLRNAFELLADPELRWSDAAFGLVIKHRAEDLVMESYCLPVLHDDRIVEDTRKVMSSTTAAPVHEAARRLIAEFAKPVLFAWPSEDRVFPIEHARRYAEQLADARVEPIDDSYSFTPEDRPEALAAAIAAG
jgi:pimeloyl-ACP methyl ester carboxylesterase